MLRASSLLCVLLAWLTVACDDSGDPADNDARPTADAGLLDAAQADATPTDAAERDVRIPDAAEPAEPDAAQPDAAEPDAADPDAAPPDPPVDAPTDVIIDVPLTGPYGERILVVPAATHWANTGLYLRAGETATITARGRWSAEGTSVGPRGDDRLGEERGCPKGSLAARSGLRFEDAITCIGVNGEHIAPRDGIVYVGMVWSTDLGDAYGSRLALEGQVEVTIRSTGATAPMVRMADLPDLDLDAIESGVLELVGDHVVVAVTTADIQRDAATAEAAIATLDAIWEDERFLRGRAPFREERVRFVEDETIIDFAYMLSSNPVRCVPDLLHGNNNQRILRAAEPMTDVWGFAHELGHAFSFANGTWVFQYNNIEVFPNIFTLHALDTLGRRQNQPNFNSYCDGREAYLADGTYEEFKADPFLELCFLMDFTATFGWSFWQTFYAGIDETDNAEIPIGGDPEHANTWGFLRDRFSQAAGEDVTPIFDAWRVPLP